MPFFGQEPSEPFWVFPHIPDRFSGWIYEDTHWSVPHVIIPFTIFLYWRSPLAVLSLVFLWEMVESILVLSTGGYLIFINEDVVELIGDSMIGDVVMGMLGILMAYLFVKAIGAYNLEMDPFTSPRPGLENVNNQVRFIIQIILFAWPNILFKVYMFDGIISVGYLIFVINYPIVVLISKKWNMRNGVGIFWERKIEWTKTNKKYGRNSQGYYTGNTNKITWRTVNGGRYYETYYNRWAVIVGLFNVTLLLRYTHVFVMTTIMTVLSIIGLLIYLSYTGNLSRDIKKKSTDKFTLIEKVV
jgi:hypothetical protein